MQLFLNELVSSIIQVLLFALIPLIVWAVRYRKRENFFSWLGFRKIGPKDRKKVMISGAVVFAAAFAVGQIALLLRGSSAASDSSFRGMGASAVPAAVVYSFIQTALSEEILFRGFLLKRLSGLLGFAAGNLLQGVIFGALHLVMVWGKVGITAGAVIFLYPVLAAVMLGYLNEKISSGSVLPGWIVHGLLNTVTQLMQIL